jgi:hypothetical protein
MGVLESMTRSKWGQNFTIFRVLMLNSA